MNDSAGHGPPGLGRRSELRVGHLVANYLHITENWIHSQILAPPAVSPPGIESGRTDE